MTPTPPRWSSTFSHLKEGFNEVPFCVSALALPSFFQLSLDQHHVVRVGGQKKCDLKKESFA